MKAVNLGDGAGSVGAVGGQVIGSIWGYSGIPERWECAWPGATNSSVPPRRFGLSVGRFDNEPARQRARRRTGQIVR